METTFEQLSVLFGPNAAGKSNILDALQLLSRIATSRTLKEAFDPPYRGKPLESFSFGKGGVKEHLSREQLRFTLEADIRLSDAVVESVDRRIREMRHPGRKGNGGEARGRPAALVRERNLRYRVEVEMLPRSGVLRLADEYLAALTDDGKPKANRKPFLERKGDKLHLRLERQSHPRYYDRFLDHSILSMPHYPPHYPHVAAARKELESWMFFYFEPRERMRASNPVKEVRHIGLMGEELATFLNTAKATNPKGFKGIEKSLQVLVPGIDGIEVDVNELGEVELRLREGDVSVPARVVSEGTLRLLGLLALGGIDEAPSLVGFEEPENGGSPASNSPDRRVPEDMHAAEDDSVHRHNPFADPSRPPAQPLLLAVRRDNGETRAEPLAAWGSLARGQAIGEALSDEQELSISERIMRGDFGA